MALRAKLLNGINNTPTNNDSEIQAWLSHILAPGIMPTAWTDDLEVTATELKAGRCLIAVTRTNVTPNETYLVLISNPTALSISPVANKKIYLEIPQNNINDSTLNTDANGESIAELKIEDAFPSSNYLALAETDGGGALTDLRINAKLIWSTIDWVTTSQITGWNNKILYTDSSGDVQEIGFWTITHALTSNWPWVPPSFQAVTVDINWLILDNGVLWAVGSELVFWNWSANRKRYAKASLTVEWLVQRASDADAELWTDEAKYVNPKQALLRMEVEVLARSTAAGSWTQVITHSLGVEPKAIMFELKWFVDATSDSSSSWTYDWTDNKCCYQVFEDNTSWSQNGTSTSYSLFYADNGGSTYVWAVTAVSSSDFTITWTDNWWSASSSLQVSATLFY